MSADDGAPVGREECGCGVYRAIADDGKRRHLTTCSLATPPTARTAGSLTADDLGRTVTVGEHSGVLGQVHHDDGITSLRWRGRSSWRWWFADTPVHVHDEEAGR